MIRIDLNEEIWRRHRSGRAQDVLFGFLIGAPAGMGCVALSIGQLVAGPACLAVALLLSLVIALYLRAQR